MNKVGSPGWLLYFCSRSPTKNCKKLQIRKSTSTKFVWYGVRPVLTYTGPQIFTVYIRKDRSKTPDSMNFIQDSLHPVPSTHHVELPANAWARSWSSTYLLVIHIFNRLLKFRQTGMDEPVSTSSGLVHL